MLVGLGGAVGSMLRYGAYLVIRTTTFPLSTLLINISGSLLIGIVFGMNIKSPGITENWRVFLATGICGGFTTFSAFSLENLQLLHNEKYVLFALYVILSLLLGLAAAFCGYKVAA